MAKIAVNRVTHANVYANGASLLGRAEEVTLPELKHKMGDHKGLGLVGELEIPSGLEKMEAKIKWASFYEEVARKFSAPGKAIALQIRANLEKFTGQGRTEEVAVVYHLTGFVKGRALGTLKKDDALTQETTLSVIYLKEVAGGVTIVEIDVLENIYKVDSVDILAALRRNIGA